MLKPTVSPIWGLRPGFYYCQTVAGLLMWGALSDGRAGLSFTIAAGPLQRRHSRVRVPWDHVLLSQTRDFLFRRLQSQSQSQSQSYITTGTYILVCAYNLIVPPLHDGKRNIQFVSYRTNLLLSLYSPVIKTTICLRSEDKAIEEGPMPCTVQAGNSGLVQSWS
jgi:hypothetical protein